MAFHAGNWSKAIAAFEECLKATPNDKLADIYIERCHHLQEEDPKDWNGIWVMKSK